MNKLFENKSSCVPLEVLIPLRDEARRLFECNEDKWTSKELGWLQDKLEPHGYGWVDAHLLKNQCILSRKNKVKTTPKDASVLVSRLQKLARDFQRERERRGSSCHTKSYRERLSSDSWKLFCRDMKARCRNRCQICGKLRIPSCLELHHTIEGYHHIGYEQPWHVLVVCSSRAANCHLVLDLMREAAAQKQEDSASLFDEEGYQHNATP